MSSTTTGSGGNWVSFSDKQSQYVRELEQQLASAQAEIANLKRKVAEAVFEYDYVGHDVMLHAVHLQRRIEALGITPDLIQNKEMK